MKFSKYFMLATAAALMSACTSEAPVDNIVEKDDNGNAVSYINLAINLPTEIASRAAGNNDIWDNGEVSEWKVTTSSLVIFQGTTEKDAKVVEVCDLSKTLRPWDNVDTSIDATNITTSASVIAKTHQLQYSNTDPALYALIVLNMEHSDVVAAFPTGDNAITFEEALSKKVSTISGFSMGGDNGFVMLNAPKKAAAANTISTLVKIPSNAIFYSAEEARSGGNPVEISVERLAAKVSMTFPTSDANRTVEQDNKTFTINVLGWDIDVVNTDSYLIHNVDEAWLTGTDSDNRFFSATDNRIYWAKDPDYSTKAASYGRVSASDLAASDKVDAPRYCYENTFNVLNMMQDRTTRVVVKGQLKKEDGTNMTTFFTVAGGNEIYSLEELEDFVASKAAARLTKTDGTPMDDVDKYDFIQSPSFNASAGVQNISVGDLKYDGANVPQDQIDELNTLIGDIRTYLNGQSYFVIRIKHFGDNFTHTAWAPGDPTYGDITPNSLKYLGRYGVVRNNWYEVAIRQFKSIGEPNVPTPENIPDDENYSYVNFSVKMHSWAKRVQTEEI